MSTVAIVAYVKDAQTGTPISSAQFDVGHGYGPPANNASGAYLVEFDDSTTRNIACKSADRIPATQTWNGTQSPMVFELRSAGTS